MFSRRGNNGGDRPPMRFEGGDGPGPESTPPLELEPLPLLDDEINIFSSSPAPSQTAPVEKHPVRDWFQAAAKALGATIGTSVVTAGYTGVLNAAGHLYVALPNMTGNILHDTARGAIAGAVLGGGLTAINGFVFKKKPEQTAELVYKANDVVMHWLPKATGPAIICGIYGFIWGGWDASTVGHAHQAGTALPPVKDIFPSYAVHGAKVGIAAGYAVCVAGYKRLDVVAKSITFGAITSGLVSVAAAAGVLIYKAANGSHLEDAFNAGLAVAQQCLKTAPALAGGSFLFRMRRPQASEPTPQSPASPPSGSPPAPPTLQP